MDSEISVKIVHQNDVSAGQVDIPGASGITIQWLIGPDDGAPNFYTRRFTIEPGGNTPRHSHPHEHEVYILSGEGECFIDGQWHTFEKDYAILVPPAVEHQFRSISDKPVVLLCIIPK